MLLQDRLSLKARKRDQLTYTQERDFGDLMSTLEEKRMALMALTPGGSTHMLILCETEGAVQELHQMMMSGEMKSLIEHLYNSLAKRETKFHIRLSWMPKIHPCAIAGCPATSGKGRTFYAACCVKLTFFCW